MTELDKKNMPFVEPFETDCDPCYAPECGHTARCIKKLQAENKHQADFLSLAKEEMDSLQTKNKKLHAKLIIAEADVRRLRKWVKEAANAVKDFEDVQADNKELKERIEFAVDYLPDCPDQAKAFLTPALKKGG